MAFSFYKHRIAETEKAVASLDRDAVILEHALASRESRDKHEKRALGQVEIRYKRIRDLEFVSRIYEYLCPSTLSWNCSIFKCN